MEGGLLSVLLSLWSACQEELLIGSIDIICTYLESTGIGHDVGVCCDCGKSIP